MLLCDFVLYFRGTVPGGNVSLWEDSDGFSQQIPFTEQKCSTDSQGEKWQCVSLTYEVLDLHNFPSNAAFRLCSIPAVAV